MPTLYSWLPVMRFVPQAGVEEYLSIYEAFPGTAGPVKVNADHVPEMETRLDATRRTQVRGFGFRPVCAMTFEVVDSAEQVYLSAMVTRLMATDDWTCYLSLDDGQTYRQVVLSKWTGPDPIRGKTFAGSTYTLTMRGVDLLEEVPLLGLGKW